MVRIAGLEPARITPLPPQSSASANSAICAGLAHSITSKRSNNPRRIKQPKHVVKPVASLPKRARRSVCPNRMLPRRFGTNLPSG